MDPRILLQSVTHATGGASVALLISMILIGIVGLAIYKCCFQKHTSQNLLEIYGKIF